MRHKPVWKHYRVSVLSMATLWNIYFFVYAVTSLFMVPGHELKRGKITLNGACNIHRLWSKAHIVIVSSEKYIARSFTRIPRVAKRAEHWNRISSFSEVNIL
jgi:hypothetical protein